jgi:hypothetical protein
MITFVPKPNVPSVLDEIEENRFERIRNDSAERHRKGGYRQQTPPRSTEGRGHERMTQTMVWKR